jgi:ribose transport system substrate-binding protein
MRRMAFIALLVYGVLQGCARDSHPDVVMLVPIRNLPFYLNAACGARRELESRGLTFKLAQSDRFDPIEQAYVLDAVLAARPRVLLVAPANAEVLRIPLLQAQARGIHVILYDSSVNGSQFPAVVTDNHRAGRLLAERLADSASGQPADVAVLTNPPGDSITDARLAGLEEGLTERNELHYLGRYRIDTSDPNLSATVAAGLLASHPDLRFLVATNANAMDAAIQALSERDPQRSRTRLLGFDIDTKYDTLLRQGRLIALVGIDSPEEGKQAAVLAADAIAGLQVKGVDVEPLLVEGPSASEAIAKAYGCRHT